PGRIRCAVVNESFATAHRIRPGESLGALIGGRRQVFEIVGIAISPEFVYATREGAMADDSGFAVLWLDREPLAAMLELTGAFNSVALKLQTGASSLRTIDQVDQLLAPFGTLGAHGREDQVSHQIITQEMQQWRVNGVVMPIFFLVVSVFVLNIVIARLVTTQRDQVAALKALGYTDREIRDHYLKMAAAIVGVGLVLGLAIGAWFAHAITRMYAELFHFPEVAVRLPPRVILIACLISLAGGAFATASAVRGIVALAPAEALRPAAPAAYRPTLLERVGLGRALGPSARMIARSLERRPLRALATTLGIAGSVGVLVSGIWWRDAVDHLIDLQFNAAQPADVQLVFVDPLPPAAILEIERLPGVVQAEAVRSVGIRIRNGHLNVRSLLSGLPHEQRLRRFVDLNADPLPIPAGGLVLSSPLAQRLNVAPGDAVEVTVLEGAQRRTVMTVQGVVNDHVGGSSYVEHATLRQLVREPHAISAAFVTVDATEMDRFVAAVRRLPHVASVFNKQQVLDSFRETTAGNLLFFTSLMTAFAASIAIGVVYNSARIALAERSWELATLRVLGFRDSEASQLLLGELALELLLALPLGFALGYSMAALLIALTPTDAYVIPLVIWPRTYAFAALTMLAAGVASALLVRRRVAQLDLVAVLKTRE
ncbi:MAG TPA: ABC transporter permease, partial [Burkholderiaceae bacterium]|nr:ABC transporter permease [Burkholderiaceae bacterium]